METVRVLQVAGFKDSGKTTLIRTLLKEANARGLRAAAVKHHGHGGAPAMPDAETDSMQFFKDDAAASVVSGGGIVQLHMKEDESGPMQLIRIAAAARPDIVFVEGFKEAEFEKIILIRSEDDWKELNKLPNIVLTITGRDIEAGGAIGREDTEAIRGWFGRWLEGGTGHVQL